MWQKVSFHCWECMNAYNWWKRAQILNCQFFEAEKYEKYEKYKIHYCWEYMNAYNWWEDAREGKRARILNRRFFEEKNTKYKIGSTKYKIQNTK